MKNIPDKIDDAFRCFAFSNEFKKYNAYLLCRCFLYDINNLYIIIHDGRNVNVKFGYDKRDVTFISYQKLISKDNIFKLTKEDLE